MSRGLKGFLRKGGCLYKLGTPGRGGIFIEKWIVKRITHSVGEIFFWKPFKWVYNEKNSSLILRFRDENHPKKNKKIDSERSEESLSGGFQFWTISEESVRFFPSWPCHSQSKIEDLYAIPIMVCMVPRHFVPQCDTGKRKAFLAMCRPEGFNYFY